MTDLEKILYTSIGTIIGGIIIYVFGQWISKFIIEPIQEQKRAIGRLIDFLIYYANVYSNPRKIEPGDAVPKLSEQAAVDLRKVASELMARTLAIPCYRFLAIIRLTIPKKKIIIAHRNLIGISNSIFSGDRKENKISREKIAEALGCQEIFQPYGEG